MSRVRGSRVVWVACVLLTSVLPVGVDRLLAQQPADEMANAPRSVAAMVDGEPVYGDEVERELQRVLRGRSADESARAALRATALDQLVDRRLILRWLRRGGRAATDADIDLAIQQLEQRLAVREVTLDQYLQRLGMRDVGDLRQALAWQLSWQRLLDQYLTDANLQRYFDDHRRDFDGSQCRVAHLLLTPAGDQPEKLEAALRKAARIRAQIMSGELSFAGAARQHSAAPTADEGGDIGFIRRRGDMPEAFSQAAFALAAGEISPPTVTPFGVHLIQCIEVRPGERTWQDARPELERAVTEYLFEWAADRERPNSRVEYSIPPGAPR